MTTNPCMNLDRLNPSTLEPQYVHHLEPTCAPPPPPPEVLHSDPKRKGVKRWCDRYIGAFITSLLLLLLVAGVLFGYYWSSPCMRGVACGDGGCVWESQWCDGVRDCPGGQDESSCLRLYGASSLLQAYSSQGGTWKGVCSRGWTDHHGRAGCQQIGYDRSTYVASGRQQGASDSGVFTVSPEWSPEVSVLRQLVLSDACPDNRLVTLHCIDCGRGAGVSGRPGVRGDWPWVVSLQLGGRHRCAGSIITPQWVVTTAHCVARDRHPEDWSLYAGMVTSMDTLFSPAHPVGRIVVHEGFSRQAAQNDIALVKMARPLNISISSDIGPVCLPNTGLNFSRAHNCSVLGFGRAPGEDTLRLTEAALSLVDSGACNGSGVHGGRVPQDMICAQHKEGGDSVWQGEGGGPLVCGAEGVWWLVGLAGRGGQPPAAGQPRVYGDVARVLSWMYGQMKRYPDEPALDS